MKSYFGKKRGVLVINLSGSECADCGKNADPDSKIHILPKGWINEGTGCGVKFKYVTSYYGGMAQRIREMRPDLQWIDNFDLEITR